VVTRVSCSVYGAPESDPKLARRAVDLAQMPFIMPPKHYPLSRWLEAQLASIGVKSRNIVARPPYMEVVLQMVIAGRGVAILFDEHSSEYVERGELRVLRTMPVPAFRVMLLGRRALRPEMAPALRFLRRVVSAPEQRIARTGQSAS
jgi:DNA-binding transcriptional LysR family regulator